jgi:peptide/nickel transport system permease protein
MIADSTADTACFWEVLFARRNVLVALILFLVIAVLCLLAPLIAPADPFKMAERARLAEPGALYWLGADAFSRDMTSRLLYAGQASRTIGLGGATISSMIGIAIGLVAGFFRRLDAPMSRLIDAMMAFPDILLAIAPVSILSGSMVNVMIALSIVYAPRIARIVRASTLVIRELPYVEAARALGSSTWAIMTTQVLRNIMSPIIVQATFIFAYAMLAEAGLSFLSVGVNPATPTWGDHDQRRPSIH